MNSQAVEIVEARHGDYLISTDPSRVDVDVVHRYLSEDSYWAAGRELETQRNAVANSPLVIGCYDENGDQAGFARMVTDLATFAWLCDVFVLPDHSGHGLGKVMVRMIVEHPAVVGLGLHILATRDAHGLYNQVGYKSHDKPDWWMERRA